MCAFQIHGCSDMVASHGGFDVHHRWPKEMGGAEHQSDELALCPNHHRRQHALIRYLVERLQAGQPTSDVVLRSYAPVEREAAEYALASWVAAGQPHVTAWSAAAAR